MYEQRPADVPIIWSSGRPAPGFCRRLCRLSRLKLLNICSSCRKQKQVCNTRTVVSKKPFFIKSSIFVLVPWEVSSRSGTLRPLGDLQVTSPACRVPDRTPFISLCFYRDTCIHKHIYIQIYIYKRKPSKVILSDHLAEIFFVLSILPD